MRTNAPWRPRSAAWGLALLVGLLLGGLWVARGGAGGAPGADGALAPVVAVAPGPERAPVVLSAPPEPAPEAVPEARVAEGRVQEPPPPAAPSAALAVQQASKPGLRLVDGALGTPLGFALVALSGPLEPGGRPEQSEHRADLRGRVGGIRERLADALELLVCEPDGRVLERIAGEQLRRRLEQGPGGPSLAVACGPSVLVDQRALGGLALELELLALQGLGSRRVPAPFVGAWDGVAVHRASATDAAAYDGLGRVYARAPGAGRAGLATTELDALVRGELHGFDLLPAEGLSYRVSRALQEQERVFVGLTPASDTRAAASVWGAAWVGALCEPASPYLLEGGFEVELAAVPAGTWRVELLTNYGVRGAESIETGGGRRELARELSWSRALRPRTSRDADLSPFAPLRLTRAADGSFSSLAVAGAAPASSDGPAAEVLYRIARPGEPSTLDVELDGRLETLPWTPPFPSSASVALAGDFDEGSAAYVLTAGVVGHEGDWDVSSGERRLLEQLGYSPEPTGLAPAVRGQAVSRALRGQRLALAFGEPLLLLRQLAASGGGAADSAVGLLDGQREAELQRGLTGVVLVHQLEPGRPPVPWDPDGAWDPGPDFRPLAAVEVAGAGGEARTDLFGLAAVHVEGDAEVEVRLPGLAPLVVGTGRGLRERPGILGLPAFEPR